MTTWRTFATRRNAELYELGCWLRILRRRAAEGDGTLLNVLTRLRERVVDEWADDHVSLRDWLATLTNAELIALRDRLANLPMLGRRAHNDALNEVDGWSLRWDVPRQTAAGEWAVTCPPFDAGGGPEPTWPPTGLP